VVMERARETCANRQSSIECSSEPVALRACMLLCCCCARASSARHASAATAGLACTQRHLSSDLARGSACSGPRTQPSCGTQAQARVSRMWHAQGAGCCARSSAARSRIGRQ
jgi:hypothetical protein